MPNQVSRVNEEAMALSFLPKMHERKRQYELKRYHDGRTRHHNAATLAILVDYSRANASIY